MKTISTKLIAVISLALIVGVQDANAESVFLWVHDSLDNSIILGDGGVTIPLGNASVIGGGDLSPVVGQINLSGRVGDWTFQTQAAGSVISGAGAMELAFNAAHSAPTTSALTMEFTQTFTTPAFDAWLLSLSGTQLNINGTTVTYSAFQSNTNTGFVSTNQIGSSLMLTGAPFSGGTNENVGGVVAPYSLTQRIRIAGGGGPAEIVGAARLTPIPEATSLLLLGFGLAGTCLMARLKTRT